MMDSRIERIRTGAYKIPTDGPESDGTLPWASTTFVLVEIQAESQVSLGYTYADEATASLISQKLDPLVQSRDPLDINNSRWTMQVETRNEGRPGIVSMGISAIDSALWDLKAKLFNVPLAKLLGQVRESVPVYGSGGFTFYSQERLCTTNNSSFCFLRKFWDKLMKSFGSGRRRYKPAGPGSAQAMERRRTFPSAIITNFTSFSDEMEHKS